MLRRVLGLVFALSPGFCCAQPIHEETAPSATGLKLEAMRNPDPLRHWEVDLETGAIWKVGGDATPLSYVVLPQILTLKTPAQTHLSLLGGDLVMRSRFSLLLEPIIRGPENYYVGLSASGCLEWWNIKRTTSFFFAAGGGLGVMHSKGYEVEGGQGQDLNFNWLVYLGARKRWTPRMSASLGIYFQHLSNTGLDKINPGLNALGPMFGFSWHY